MGKWTKSCEDGLDRELIKTESERLRKRHNDYEVPLR